MDSIYRQYGVRRISYVNDTSAGAQGGPKEIKEYVGSIKRTLEIKDESAGSQGDFKRAFGAGI